MPTRTSSVAQPQADDESVTGFSMGAAAGGRAAGAGVGGRIARRSPFAQRFAERLDQEAGVRFGDVVDHIELYSWPDVERRLRDADFSERPELSFTSGKRFYGDDETKVTRSRCFVQSQGIFPAILLADDPSHAGHMDLAVKVESTADFAVTHGLSLSGELPLSPFRSMSIVTNTAGAWLHVVERHGFRQFRPPVSPPSHQVRLQSLCHAEQFRARTAKAVPRPTCSNGPMRS